jgi:hypothetical protein
MRHFAVMLAAQKEFPDISECMSSGRSFSTDECFDIAEQ